MKVKELLEALKGVDPEVNVFFDSEARAFNYHLIALDGAFFEPTDNKVIFYNHQDGIHEWVPDTYKG